jgi:transposase InsO family protein
MPRFILASLALALVLAAAPRAGAAAQPFAGTWRAFATTGGMQCRFDLVMTTTGNYIETAHCGPYATSQRGTYRVFANGTLSRAVTAWSPTQALVVDAGGSHLEPTTRPPGGSYRYTFTNSNTMVWRDLIMGGTLTFRRLA